MSRVRAEAEISELNSRIQRAEGQLIVWRDRLTRLQVYLEVDDELSRESGAQGDGVARVAARPALSGGLAGQVREAVHSMLVAAGKPIPTRELPEMLRARGITLQSNPERWIADLSAILSRDKQTFIASRRDGWGLMEWLKKEVLDELAGEPIDGGDRDPDDRPGPTVSSTSNVNEGREDEQVDISELMR